MQAALDVDPGVLAFQYASYAFGLGYQVGAAADIAAPAFDGSVSLDYAQVAP
jgi:hypothetical protein